MKGGGRLMKIMKVMSVLIKSRGWKRDRESEREGEESGKGAKVHRNCNWSTNEIELMARGSIFNNIQELL